MCCISVEFEVRVIDFYTLGLTNCNACHPPDARMLANMIRFISLIQAGFLCITIPAHFLNRRHVIFDAMPSKTCTRHAWAEALSEQKSPR